MCAGGRSAAWRGAWRVRARRPSPSAYNKRARRTRRLASATTAAPVHDARSALCDLLAPRTSYRGKRSRRHRPRRKRDTILLYSLCHQQFGVATGRHGGSHHSRQISGAGGVSDESCVDRDCSTSVGRQRWVSGARGGGAGRGAGPHAEPRVRARTSSGPPLLVPAQAALGPTAILSHGIRSWTPKEM